MSERDVVLRDGRTLHLHEDGDPDGRGHEGRDAVVQKAWTGAAAGWFTGGKSPGAIGISDSHIGAIGLSGPPAADQPDRATPARRAVGGDPPGEGFMVHMTEATRKSVPCSYLVLDVRGAA